MKAGIKCLCILESSPNFVNAAKIFNGCWTAALCNVLLREFLTLLCNTFKLSSGIGTPKDQDERPLCFAYQHNFSETAFMENRTGVRSLVRSVLLIFFSLFSLIAGSAELLSSF